MNGSLPKSFWVFTTLIVFVHIPNSLLGSNEVDLGQITQRLKTWRSSFVSLRLVYETRRLSTSTTDPLIDWPAPADPKEGRLFARTEWVWSDDGMDLWEELPWKADGQRSMDVFNSRQGVSFRASYKWKNHGPEKLQLLKILGTGVGKPISWTGRTPVLGLYWNSSARWLPEVLSEWTWTLEGFDEIGGELCARIAPAPDTPGLGARRILWIDLSRDCLVRRYLTFWDDDPGRRWKDFIVDEFQRMPNGLWLPKRGRLQFEVEGRNQHWEVTEAAINEPLDLRRFKPPTPVVGTLVVKGGAAPYRHGTSPPRRGASPSGQQNGIGETANANQIPSRSATPPNSGWIWWSGGLAIASLIFLAAGLWFRRKRLEDPS